MTEPPTPRKKMPPVVTVALIALAVWILLAVCMGEKSLDRADKAAGVIAMLVALGAFTATVVEQQRRSSNQEGENPQEHPSLLKRPSVLAGLATMAVGLLIVVIVGFASGGGGAPEDQGPEAGSASPPDLPATTAAATAAPSASSPADGPAEPCASPGQATPTPTAASTTDAVRHDGALILSEGYYADLDSLCPDWDVTDVLGTKQDIGNDGKGLTRSVNTGTQIAVVEKSASATFGMCSSNTDYVSGVIQYEDLKQGARYCVLTDAGRRSLVTVKRVRRDGGRTTVHVDVRTWAERRPSEETNYLPWVILGVLVLMMLGGGAKTAAGKAGEDKS